MQFEAPKVLTAIVTFNGAETIKETLTALKDQQRPPDAFLIIDNASTDSTLAIVGEMGIISLEVFQQTKNEGVGVAYNIALNNARKKKFDWLWLFDQDSICQPDCLEKLLAEAEVIMSYGMPAAALFPTHYSKSHPGHLLPPLKWTGREMIDVVPPDHSDKNHTQVHTSMTSGALYNLSLIMDEPGFREDFFIDFVDHEYHMRLMLKGYQLFCIKNARIFHELGKTKTNDNGQIVHYHHPWRYYFIGRNMFYCYRNWGGLRAQFYLWKAVKQHYAEFKTIAEFDHKTAWKYFKIGIRDSFFQRFYKIKPPKLVIQSIQ